MFLLGANLPEDKLIRVALRNIFGIGRFKSDRICNQLGLHPACRVRDLSEGHVSTISRMVEEDPDKCGHELQRKIAERVTHYYNIKSFRGLRLAEGLPSRGQRSHPNAYTAG
jgi:small subunit ribosomal protein S13